MADVHLDSLLLARLAARYGFPYREEELVLFGIRGALPAQGQPSGLATGHDLVPAEVDHLRFACTLGQWRPETGECAVFPGSTVPAGAAIEKALRGQMAVNQLLPGRYEYVRGEHGIGRRSGHRALRQASFAPVQRSRDNATFDIRDGIDFGQSAGDFVWDNIHAAYTPGPAGFSSAGCQVVAGLPRSPARDMAPEEGPWKLFVDGVYGRFAAQAEFTYLLYTMAAVALVRATPEAQLRQWVCYGSSGPAAEAVQQALIARGLLPPGSADADFGRQSLIGLVTFQRRELGDGAADGVCGPMTAAALGIDLPLVAGGVPPAAGPRVQAPLAAPDATSDEPDLAPDILRELGERFRLRRTGGGLRPGDIDAGPEPDRLAGLPVPQPSPFDTARFVASLEDQGMRLADPLRREGMLQVVRTWWRLYPGSDPRWLAYVLASVFHETGGRMLPVREGFAATDAAARAHVRRLFQQGRISKDYARPVKGISYYGRGRVQTTHRENYERLGRRFRRDLVAHPDLLLDPALDAEVACIGHVEGLWTGQRLSAFIGGGRCDYAGARAIVNGTDKAERIAGHARAFEEAITAALSAGPVPVAPIPRLPEEPVDMMEETMDHETAAVETQGQIDDLQKAVEELRARIRPAATAGATPVSEPLTPVNAVLGQTIGSALDGRKSFIGLLGSVIVAIIGSATPGGWLGNLAAAVGQAVPALDGATGKVMPVTLAMAAWGLVGKLEKAILRGPAPH